VVVPSYHGDTFTDVDERFVVPKKGKMPRCSGAPQQHEPFPVTTNARCHNLYVDVCEDHPFMFIVFVYAKIFNRVLRDKGLKSSTEVPGIRLTGGD
jgi:hypothetical protein